MRIAFVDCWSGVAGDMLLGALLDLGWPIERLRAGLRAWPVPGDRLTADRVLRAGLAGTKFSLADRPRDVGASGRAMSPRSRPAARREPDDDHGEHGHAQTHGHDHGHDHGHAHDRDHTHGGHSHRQAERGAGEQPGRDPRRTLDPARGEHRHGGRGLPEIERLVRGARLPPAVEERSLAVFRLIADVESRAHAMPVADVHFHEVGAIDTLVDVCGTVLGFHELGVDAIYASAVAVGSGTVRCEHGVLPVPAPGALGALLGVPVRWGDLAGERTTPTGAALLRVLVDAFEPRGLLWVPERSGLGAGTRDDPAVPNLLRVTLGRAGTGAAGDEETVLELRCQVDDVSGDLLGHAMDRLLALGALDVFFTPVQMKKSRPGTLITVLTDPARLDAIEHCLLTETGTLGIRRTEMRRRRLARREEVRDTAFGRVRFKVRTQPDGREVAMPEYDDVHRIAIERGLPLRDVMARLSRPPERGR